MELSIEKKFGKYRGFCESDIKHGAVITLDQIEWLHKHNHCEQELKSFCRQLQSAITDWSWTNGTPYGVRQKDYDLHIIQHDELSEYANNRKNGHYRSAARYTALLAAVDTTPMTEAQIEIHNRRLEIANDELHSMIESQKRLGIQEGSLMAFAQLDLKREF